MLPPISRAFTKLVLWLLLMSLGVFNHELSQSGHFKPYHLLAWQQSLTDRIPVRFKEALLCPSPLLSAPCLPAACPGASVVALPREGCKVCSGAGHSGDESQRHGRE